MITALTAKNKLAFINGTLPCPAATDSFKGTWIRCNSMVVSWILNSTTPKIAESLKYFNSAVDIWKDLRHRFHQSNKPRVFQLKK